MTTSPSEAHGPQGTTTASGTTASGTTASGTGASGDRPAKAAKKKHSPTAALIGVAVGIVGSVLMGWAYLAGLAISVAAKGVTDSSLYLALFFVGTGLAIAAVIIGVVGIVRRAQRVLSVASIVIVVVGALTVLVITAGMYL